jgi:hypothetical protein
MGMTGEQIVAVVDKTEKVLEEEGDGADRMAGRSAKADIARLETGTNGHDERILTLLLNTRRWRWTRRRRRWTTTTTTAATTTEQAVQV